MPPPKPRNLQELTSNPISSIDATTSKALNAARQSLSPCPESRNIPVAQLGRMQFSLEIIYQLLLGIRDFVITTYSFMLYGSTEVRSENHIAARGSISDGGASPNGQRVMRTLRKSKSTGDKPDQHGLSSLNYTGCQTDEEIRERDDAFWAPPELDLLRSFKEVTSAQPIGEESEQQAHLSHRLSSPASLRLSYDPLSQKHLSVNNQSLIHDSKTSFERGSFVEKDSHRHGPTRSSSLIERLNKLLLSQDDQSPHVLVPSGFKSAQREQQAQLRRLKEKEEAIRALKELRISRRKPLKPLIQPLSRSWDQRVEDARLTTEHERILTTSIGGTELRRKDFQTLLGSRAWLNDEIINAYLEWVVDAANKSTVTEAKSRGETVTTVPKFIAHNSFFYENLIKKGPSNTQGLMRRKRAPGVSLMEVDSVLIPICKGNHWTVGTVRPIAKSIEYFDSMGGDPRPFIRLMRGWLGFQLGDKYVHNEWTEPNPTCARQSNGYDCGVFVCTNSFCVVLGLDTSCYEERDMGLQRRNIAAILLNRGFVNDFEWGQAGL